MPKGPLWDFHEGGLKDRGGSRLSGSLSEKHLHLFLFLPKTKELLEEGKDTSKLAERLKIV
ncbi:hypothetical protein KKD61_02505 [Patescibacteria group bacterium]|nr:hypothetical protein [Patescibacteria group bacterium]